MGAPAEPVALPVALTIAGSDSGGGAGIQTDLKVFFALGCHGTSALTALTAQNTVGVTGVSDVPADFVTAQIDAVCDDMDVKAAKTGMLSNSEIVAAVAKSVSTRGLTTVVDPVFVSKHRNRLLAEEAVDALKNDLFPVARLITPNLYEAGALLGWEVTDLDGMKRAAEELKGFGPSAVLVKGGHLGSDEAIDVYLDDDEMQEIAGPRYDTEDTHGTGCALSAAITAYIARGETTATAVRSAKGFISGAIRRGIRVGRGFGPVNPGWDLFPG